MTSQQKRTEALNFLHEMKTDLEVANLLYNQKIYSRSLYSFQQAIEKGIKAQTLFFDIIEHEQLYQVSHTATDAYKIAVEVMDKQKEFLKTLYKDEPITLEFIDSKIDLNKIKGHRDFSKNILNQINEKKKRFKNMKESDLTSYQKIMDEKYNQIEKLRVRVDSDEFSVKDYPFLKEEIKKILKSDSKKHSSLEKSEDDFIDFFIILLIRYLPFNSVMKCLLDLIGSILFLTALAIISQSHHESAQYPTGKANTEKIYSAKSNPLIRHLPAFLEKGEISRKYLSELFGYATTVEKLTYTT